MIDSMTRLKVKLLAEAGLPQDKVAERCGVSTRSVQRFVKDVGDVVSSKPVGRPSRVGALIRERLAQELQKEPRILGTELLRRSRAWGYTGGRSALL